MTVDRQYRQDGDVSAMLAIIYFVDMFRYAWLRLRMRGIYARSTPRDFSIICTTVVTTPTNRSVATKV